MSVKERPTDRPKFVWVASHLYRLDPYGRYYGQARRQGKLIRESLRTDDRTTADRKLRDWLADIEKRDLSERSVSFRQVADRFAKEVLDTRALKPRGREYRDFTIENLFKKWLELETMPVRHVTRAGCARWLAKRRKDGVSGQLINNELGSLRMILDFAREHGIIGDNPADGLKRVKVHAKAVTIPTRAQFAALVNELRLNVSKEAADFVEVLGYSGMRVNEAAAVTWGEINWKSKLLAVTGGEAGTKNSRIRHIPLFAPLRRVLDHLRKEAGALAGPGDRVFSIRQCREAIQKACDNLKMRHWRHHDFRHFFCTNAIEQGVDFKTVADWLGHLDGGMLVAKLYGHLRAEHSMAMAAKITFDATTPPDNVVPGQFQKEKTA